MTIVDLAADAAPAAPFGSPDHDPVADLWARLHRPFDPVSALSALTGLSAGVAAVLVAGAVAGSPEAERLLDELPRTMRSLATSTTVHHERCRGELRGPVLWSETLSARASTYGDQDLFVCRIPARAYDVDENRVLVAALVAVRDAAAVVDDLTARRDHGTTAFRRIRRNGNDARRFVEHPSLAGVAREVPKGKALKRTRAGKKAAVYGPALRLLVRAANPLTAADIGAWCDRRTRAQLRLLTGLLAGLEAAGHPVPPVRAVSGHLEVAELTYHHGRLLGERWPPAGIMTDELLVDVPDVLAEADRARAEAWLRARAEGRRAVLVADDDDLDRACSHLLRHRADPPSTTA